MSFCTFYFENILLFKLNKTNPNFSSVRSQFIFSSFRATKEQEPEVLGDLAVDLDQCLPQAQQDPTTTPEDPQQAVNPVRVHPMHQFHPTVHQEDPATPTLVDPVDLDQDPCILQVNIIYMYICTSCHYVMLSYRAGGWARRRGSCLASSWI